MCPRCTGCPAWTCRGAAPKIKVGQRRRRTLSRHFGCATSALASLKNIGSVPAVHLIHLGHIRAQSSLFLRVSCAPRPPWTHRAAWNSLPPCWSYTPYTLDT
jgi:hypothetical protein